jgi:hypothetical protein
MDYIQTISTSPYYNNSQSQTIYNTRYQHQHDRYSIDIHHLTQQHDRALLGSSKRRQEGWEGER